MNRNFVFTIITIILMLSEPLFMEIFPSLTLFPPEFALLSVIYTAYAVKETTYQGALSAVILGYLMDLLCGAPVGMFSFVYVVLFFISRMISGKVFAKSLVVQIVLGMTMSILAGLFIVSLDKWLSPIPHRWSSLLRIPWQALSTGVMAPIYFNILWRIDKRISYEASSEGVFK